MPGPIASSSSPPANTKTQKTPKKYKGKKKAQQDNVVEPPNSTYRDSSGPIFSLYIRLSQKFDKETTENWKGGAEGILVFVCSDPDYSIRTFAHLHAIYL